MPNYWTFFDAQYPHLYDSWGDMYRDDTDPEVKRLKQEKIDKASVVKARMKQVRACEKKLAEEKRVMEEQFRRGELDEQAKTAKEQELNNRYLPELDRLQKELDDANKELEETDQRVTEAFEAFAFRQYENIKHRDLEEYSGQIKELAEYDNPDFAFRHNVPENLQEDRKRLRMRLTEKMFHEAAREKKFFEKCRRYGEVYDRPMKSGEFNLFYLYADIKPEADAIEAFAEDRKVLDHIGDHPETAGDVYGIFRKAVRTVSQEQLNWLASKKTWTDEDIVNHFELINKIVRLSSIREDLESQTSRMAKIKDKNKNSVERRTFVPPDKELYAFFALNEEALSRAIRLSQRAGYIQSVYYDVFDMDKQPNLKEFFESDIDISERYKVTENSLQNTRSDKTTLRADITDAAAGYLGAVRREHNKDYDKLTKEEKFDMELQKIGFTEIYETTLLNQTQVVADNIAVIKNVFRSIGTDMAALSVEYRDDNGALSASAEGLFQARPMIEQDESCHWFERIVNNKISDFTFKNLDNPKQMIKIPRDALLNPDFAERLRDVVRPENIGKKIPQPSKKSPTYQQDLALYQLSMIYQQGMTLVYRAALNKKSAEVASADFANIEDRAREIDRQKTELENQRAVQENAPTKEVLAAEARLEAGKLDAASIGRLSDPDRIYDKMTANRKNLSALDQDRYRKTAELISVLSDYSKAACVDSAMKKQLESVAKFAAAAANGTPGGKIPEKEMKLLQSSLKSLTTYETSLNEQMLTVMDEKTEYQVAQRLDMVVGMKELLQEHAESYQAMQKQQNEPVKNAGQALAM